VQWELVALQDFDPANVRYGSLAGMAAALLNVRFTPKSRHH
jgi:hypothetical protein